jgi:hypothetical protein
MDTWLGDVLVLGGYHRRCSCVIWKCLFHGDVLVLGGYHGYLVRRCSCSRRLPWILG